MIRINVYNSLTGILTLFSLSSLHSGLWLGLAAHMGEQTGREHREQHSGERRPENREKKKFRHMRARVDPKTGKPSFEVQFA